MPSMDEIRAELASRRPDRSGTTITILGVFAAFLVGGLLVYGWQLLPAGSPVAGMAHVKPSGQPEITIPASSDRVGQPSSAPLLSQCMTRVAGGSKSTSAYRKGSRDRGSSRSSASDVDFEGINAGMMYAMLQAGKTLTIASSLSGQDNAGNVLLANKWGELAECVYNQDSAALCDRNNRALAVESLTNHLRNGYRAIAEAGSASENRALSQLRAINERVMAALRTHLRDGVVIAADFGMFGPDEIKRAAAATKPIRNVCAAQRG